MDYLFLLSVSGTPYSVLQSLFLMKLNYVEDTGSNRSKVVEVDID